MAVNSIYCATPSSTFAINFSGNTILTGQTWLATQNDGKGDLCVEIIRAADDTNTWSAKTQFTDCHECLTNNYALVTVTNCIDDVSYTITYTSFGTYPVEKNVFFGTISFQNGTEITSCFSIGGIREYTEFEYNNAIANSNVGYVTDPTPNVTSFFSDCIQCYTASALPYSVRRCGTEIDDIVGLVDGASLIGNIISYTNGVTQYCGTVVNLSSAPIQYQYVQDFGSVDAKCDVCLAIDNLKVKLVSCTDSENTIVVWASSLFEVGETSSLSTSQGCFEISGFTDEPVDQPILLDFDPQPTCQDCIECNGIVIGVVGCGEVEPVTTYWLSHQYVNVGDFIYHYDYGNCVEVVDIAPGDTPYQGVLYSFPTSESCETCEGEPFQIYQASACSETLSGSTFEVVITGNSLPGNVHKIYWGDNPFICVTLLEGEPTYSGEYYFAKELTTCEECSNDRIGVIGINCDTGENRLFNLTQEDYIKNYFLNQYSVFKTNQGCFLITNPCPYQATGTNANITDYYDFCFECNYDPFPPRSANTESFICQICCPCTTGSTITSVAPPHPVWTDGQGTAVTQLNMVVLGGENGLNS